MLRLKKQQQQQHQNKQIYKQTNKSAGASVIHVEKGRVGLSDFFF